MGNGDGNAKRGGHALTGSWLAARLGTQSARVEGLRRAGELYGVRTPGSQEYRYPAWQFDRLGRIRPIVPRLIAAAREAGLSDDQLADLLERRRVGLVGGGHSVADLVRTGDDEGALAVLRASIGR
jgi:hypothetical protein